MSEVRLGKYGQVHDTITICGAPLACIEIQVAQVRSIDQPLSSRSHFALGARAMRATLPTRSAKATQMTAVEPL